MHSFFININPFFCVSITSWLMLTSSPWFCGFISTYFVGTNTSRTQIPQVMATYFNPSSFLKNAWLLPQHFKDCNFLREIFIGQRLLFLNYIFLSWLKFMKIMLAFYLMFNCDTCNIIFIPDVYTTIVLFLLLLNWPAKSANWIISTSSGK